MPNINRRSLITGLISFVAAPAIVRAGSLMPVKLMTPLMPDVFSWGPQPLVPFRPGATGGITFNSQPIYKPDGTPLIAGDLIPSTVFRVVLNGGRWVMV
jgi:hypothetical protein